MLYSTKLVHKKLIKKKHGKKKQKKQKKNVFFTFFLTPPAVLNIPEITPAIEFIALNYSMACGLGVTAPALPAGPHASEAPRVPVPHAYARHVPLEFIIVGHTGFRS